ncbi:MULTISPECIES: choice-of-anchor I family protein [unclassified Pseudoalteromonas]|uniref:choice-of-anchor I family protein n=1 Tax=unclassified Pseudoalteromonas TaxID=194690 RepID=UPI000CF6F01B|nr:MULTISPECIES: choice-of-anchor I family protein [unclassified Pseudoalteromonas]
MKKTLIALTLASVLAGCSLDGDDGSVGATGPQGPQGEQGESGQAISGDLELTLVGRAVLNAESPEGAAEIVAFHARTQQIYAINSSGDKATVEIIAADNFDVAALVADNEGVISSTNLDITTTLDVSANTPGDANSIAIDANNDLLAVAMAAETGVKGQVAFYDISGEAPLFLHNVEVGYLPDMVTFTPDGTKVVVANEGEPAGDYSVDPEGSIAVIAIESGKPAIEASLLGFSQFNDQQAELAAQGVVFANPTGRTIKGQLINTTVAMDLEPEYVAISADSKTAYVSLQENNALAVVDLENMTLEVRALGFKDWGNLLIDASDKDGGINFQQYPGLFGMYQPDTIATYQWQGADFVVSANEGDGREYFFDSADEASCLAEGGLEFDEDDGCLAYIDESRAEDLDLADNFAYVNNDDDDIGRLIVSTVRGDADQDGRYEQLYAYGARSFSIWDANTGLVFDSGDDVGRITAAIHGSAFNNNEDENEGDTRSDAKGAEPEALALGQVQGRTYAFVGLERMGGIMVYDITNPFDVKFKNYASNRGLVEGADITGDLAPEGMRFISAEQSPNGMPLLVVGNEISGSVSVWQIDVK